MLVTLLPIVMLEREEQPQNAHSPILVTESGIWMLEREEQKENAYSPMLDIFVPSLILTAFIKFGIYDDG